MRVRVVGAGIAGLTAALCLARAGHEVDIDEAASALEPVGAGIQLPPNAMAVIRELGLEHAVNATASAPRSIDVIDGPSGRRLTRLPLGAAFERRFGAPYLVIHRGDLHHVLLDAVVHQPRVSLRLGTRWTGAAAEEGTWTIGADGVHSETRRRVRTGAGVEAVASGFVAWRGLVDTRAVEWPEARSRVVAHLGSGAHLVHYPVSSGRRINIVAIAREDAGAPMHTFGAWSERSRTLAEAVDDWSSWPILSVDEGAPWSRGRTALIGDAAHAMWPYAAQGGAMALEDAATLAAALADGDVAEWERRRRARVARVAALARRNRRIYHLGGMARLARNVAMRLAPPAVLTRASDALYSSASRP